MPQGVRDMLKVFDKNKCASDLHQFMGFKEYNVTLLHFIRMLARANMRGIFRNVKEI